MKDPDDFPVSEEADRNIVCRDCGTRMAPYERGHLFYADKIERVCCQCGSTEIEEDGLRAVLHDIARGL